MEGTLEQVAGAWQLRFIRTLPHSQEKVWRAITQPEHLATWFPSSIEGERKPGAQLRFTFPGNEVPPVEGEMIAWDPPTLFAFNWGGDVLRFELEARGPEETILTLTDTFQPVGKGARDAAGWHACLDRLEHELAGTTPDWNPGERWAQVHKIYVARFPKEATTIGPPPGSEPAK